MSDVRMEDLPHYTYDDYLQWEGCWELIHGIPYAMSPSPGILHQSISTNIAWQLKQQLMTCNECQALLPVDWKIDEDTTVQPDNLVVCGNPTGNYLTEAPVLIFEILSHSTEKKDKITKFRLYEKEGVRYYIIIDPKEKLATIYHLNGGRYIKSMDATEESCDFDLGKCRIAFDFAKIWA